MYLLKISYLCNENNMNYLGGKRLWKLIRNRYFRILSGRICGR